MQVNATRPRPDQLDPAGITLLWGRAFRKFNSIFRRLNARLWNLIVTYDCFGLSGRKVSHRPQGYPDWSQLSDDQKAETFYRWLQAQIGDLFYKDKGRWFLAFIDAAWEKGAEFARDQLSSTPDLEANVEYPDVLGFILGSGTPESFQELVDEDYSEGDFTDYKGSRNSIRTTALRLYQGMTADLADTIYQILRDGLATGLHPYQVARQIRDATAMSLRRAKVIARTEMMRAHHNASIDIYEAARVEGVKVKAEWLTAGDERVCPICASLEGKVFTLEEVRPMIPVHPSCRCVAVPFVE